jgi:iron complex outermembrane receptor protein
VFGQVEYAVTERFHIIPGLRYNYDKKKIDYNQTVYGGLQTTNAALIALQRSILSPLAYKVDAGDSNVSGALTLSYKTSAWSNVYATYSRSYKPLGLNLGGVPTDNAGNPVLSAATVRPENVRHIELGIKTTPWPGYTANFALYESDVRDYQTQVVNAQVGVLRGYLANAKKVRVRGIEFDGSARVTPELNVYTSVSFTDGRYISFPNAPPPLEDTGGPQVKDISGSVLPGISKWAFSVGAEYNKRGSFLNLRGEYFARLDASYRSVFSSNPSASRYLNVPQYALFNPRIGFRTQDGLTVSLWARNLANKNYFEFLSPAPGSSGLIVGLPGDPRTYGVTIARSFGF